MEDRKIYIYAAISMVVVSWLWRNRHYFNTDIYKNFGDEKIPWIKNGFGVAFFDPVEMFVFSRNLAKKIKKSFKISTFNETQYIIIKAEDTEKILSSSRSLEKSMVYKAMHPFIGLGLITSVGEKWHKRRKMITPAFHFNILKEFFEIFKEESDNLIVNMREFSGKEIDFIPVATSFALNIILESAMGVRLRDMKEDYIKYGQNIQIVGRLLVERILKPWLHSDFTYKLFGYRRYLSEVLKPVHGFTRSIINMRKEDFMSRKKQQMTTDNSDDEKENIYIGSKKKRVAMMDTLLEAEQQGLIDDDGIMEEVDTFTFAGHDTTSNSITFTLLLLSHNQDAQRKLFEEIQEVLGDRSDFSIDDLNKMTFMERVLKETLRIFPPIHCIMRKLNEDIDIGEMRMKKGSTANIMIWDIHRDPEVFPEPERFDPDRFLPDNVKKRHKFSFIPFSAGMRNCIGQKYAILELKTVLVKVIKNYKVFPVTNLDELVFTSDIVLRSKYPIKLKFLPREKVL